MGLGEAVMTQVVLSVPCLEGYVCEAEWLLRGYGPEVIARVNTTFSAAVLSNFYRQFSSCSGSAKDQWFRFCYANRNKLSREKKKIQHLRSCVIVNHRVHAVTKYCNPPLCDCAFREALHKGRSSLYYGCPCCDFANLSLKKVVSHAWRVHSFGVGCEVDFAVWQARDSIAGCRLDMTRDVPDNILQAWQKQWDTDDMDVQLRHRVWSSVNFMLCHIPI